MRLTVVGVIIGVLVGLGVGCKSDVIYYCDENTPCKDRYPDRPFCDLYGSYDESGHIGRTCIANPIDASPGEIDASAGIDGPTSSSDGGLDAGSVNAQPDAQPTPCDPVGQTGCFAGEKCTYIIDSTTPLMGHTSCAPKGGVVSGGACTRDAGGVDDCVAGYFCSGGTCTEICSTSPNSCGGTEVCTVFAGVFDDRTDVGMCMPQCDPLNPSAVCPTGESCYLSLASAITSCVAPSLSDPITKTGAPNCNSNPGTQDCNCVTLNGCDAGFGCILLNDAANPTGNICAFFCDPMNSGGPTCASGTGAGPSFSCRQIMSFYSDAMDVDPSYGMCVNPTTWAGYCGGCVDMTDDICNPAKCCDNDPNTNDDPNTPTVSECP